MSKLNVNDNSYVKRVIIAFKCNSLTQVANIIGLSRQDLNNRISSGTFDKLIIQEAQKRNINYDWIKSGQGNMTFTTESISKDMIDIINRIKYVKKLQSDSDVAKALDISKANLSSYKVNKKIPFKAISDFCTREGILINFILYGTMPIYKHEVVQSEIPSGQIRLTAYPPTTSTASPSETTIGDLVTKTITVLESKSEYSHILRNSIETCYKAMTCETELAAAKQKINQLENLMEETKETLPAVNGES